MLYLTLRQYEYVVAVAETGSVSGAAQRVGVSQPSLSVAITQVEARIGAAIFVRRRGAPVQITPFGHGFVDRARALLAQADALERVRTAPAPFALGCFADIAPWYLAPALDALRLALPADTVTGAEGRFSDLARDLSTGRLDLAISYDIGFEAGFERQTIRQVRPVAFLSVDHPLTARTELHLTDLLPCPLILFAEPESEGFMAALFAAAQMSPTVAQRVSSLELMRSLAAHGSGIGLSYSHPPGGLSYDAREVVTRPIATPETETEIKLIWSRHALRDDRMEAALSALSGLSWGDQ